MVKAPVRITLLRQLGFSVPIFVIIYWLSPVKGYSFLLGALLYILPNLYFTLYVFRYTKVEYVHWIAKSFSTGEYGKLALAAVGFAVVLKFVQPLNAPMLFAGFCSLIVLQGFIATRVIKHINRSTEEAKTK